VSLRGRELSGDVKVEGAADNGTEEIFVFGRANFSVFPVFDLGSIAETFSPQKQRVYGSFGSWSQLGVAVIDVKSCVLHVRKARQKGNVAERIYFYVILIVEIKDAKESVRH